jgi:ribonucleoside-diphosphate reductase alpha subunit
MNKLEMKRSVSFGDDMYVINRAGAKEPLELEQILTRLKKLINRPPIINYVNYNTLAMQIVSELKTGISTTQIDEFIAQVADSKSITEPKYAELAARLVVDNHHKNTATSFLDKMKEAYLRKINNEVVPLISKEFWQYVKDNYERIHSIIKYERDFLFDYFGFKTFQKTYSLKRNNKDDKGFDRPQDMWMRIAVSIHMNVHDDINDDFKYIEQTYDNLSNMLYTHATPTISNSGTVNNQLASCFLLATDDSLDGIKDTSKEMCQISKLGGGIGLHINCIRSKGSLIRGTNGSSDGITNFLRCWDIDMQAFNQGGKRPGSAAIYLMPHHPDIEKFLQMKLATGLDNERARHLSYAVWVPDLFMERTKSGKLWSLFDPNTTKDLSYYFDSKNSKKYTEEYVKLEENKQYVKQVDPREIWNLIYESNLSTGMPYICFSDIANTYNMQNNLGVIKSSNLCTEIFEYSDNNETAVCNLASICLPKFVEDSFSDLEIKTKAIPNITHELNNIRELDHKFPLHPVFNYKKLIDVVSIAVTNLNIIIDKTLYANEKTRRSNFRHRPIAIGIQGLADVYCKMRFPFDSPEAHHINKIISETIYYAAVSQSSKLCRESYNKLKSKVRLYNDKVHLAKLNNNDTINSNNDTNTILPVTFTMHHQHDYNLTEVIFNDVKDIPKDIYAYPSMKWVGENGPSNISKGIFHWELYGVTPSEVTNDKMEKVPRYDWESLREHIKIFGVRNSLLVGLMPTATTSQLLGNNECMEPYTSNIYKRKTLAGEFIIINKWLMNDLYKLNMWTKELKDYLETCDGSIQYIDGIPDDIKKLYKTSREIDTEVLIDQAIDRQPYVDQGQSLNWYSLNHKNMDYKYFLKLSFRAWNGKLKTAKYYLHSKAAITAQKFTVDPKLQKTILDKIQKVNEQPIEDTICMSCSS